MLLDAGGGCGTGGVGGERGVRRGAAAAGDAGCAGTSFCRRGVSGIAAAGAGAEGAAFGRSGVKGIAALGGGGVGATVKLARAGATGVAGRFVRAGATGVAGSAGGGAVCRGGIGAGGSEVREAGPTENTRPWPSPSKGLLMSAGTSICRCTRRRVINAGFRRERISARGRATSTLSRSFSTVNTSGAAWRNSPNETLTAPRESWARIFSNGTEMVMLPTSGWRTRGCNSKGRLLRMFCSESSTPLPFWCATGREAGANRGLRLPAGETG